MKIKKFKMILKSNQNNLEYMLQMKEAYENNIANYEDEKDYIDIDGKVYDLEEKVKKTGVQRAEVVENEKLMTSDKVTNLSAMISDYFDSMSDTGNADRMIQDGTDGVKFLREDKDWAFWKNDRWVRDDKNVCMVQKYRRMVDTFKGNVDAMKSAAYTNGISDDKTTIKMLGDLKTWARTSGNTRTLNSCVEMLSQYEQVAESVLEFDKKGHFLGVQNGVVDLRDGKLIKNDPSYLMLKSANATYKQNAVCPIFEETILDIFKGDKDTVYSIQEMLGSSLVGVAKDKFWVLIGGGSNGKTLLTSTVNNILGAADEDGYGVSTSPRIFSVENQGNTESYLAKLKSARILVMSESSATATLRDDLVKQVCPDQDEKITARKMRGDPIEFVPTATPLLLTNNLPNVKDTSEGMWRRLVLVKFNNHYTEEQKDRGLGDKLKNETAGILNWLIEGAKRYLANGKIVYISEAIKNDTNEWKRNENMVGTFMEKKLIKDNNKENIALKDIMIMWENWGGYHCTSQYLKKKLEQGGVNFEYLGNGGLVHAVGWGERISEDLPSDRDKKDKMDRILQLIK